MDDAQHCVLIDYKQMMWLFEKSGIPASLAVATTNIQTSLHTPSLEMESNPLKFGTLSGWASIGGGSSAASSPDLSIGCCAPRILMVRVTVWPRPRIKITLGCLLICAVHCRYTFRVCHMFDK